MKDKVKASQMHEEKNEIELWRIPSVHKFFRRSTGGGDYERAALCENLSNPGLRCLHRDVCGVGPKDALTRCE